MPWRRLEVKAAGSIALPSLIRGLLGLTRGAALMTAMRTGFSLDLYGASSTDALSHSSVRDKSEYTEVEKI